MKVNEDGSVEVELAAGFLAYSACDLLDADGNIVTRFARREPDGVTVTDITEEVQRAEQEKARR